MRVRQGVEKIIFPIFYPERVRVFRNFPGEGPAEWRVFKQDEETVRWRFSFTTSWICLRDAKYIVHSKPKGEGRHLYAYVEGQTCLSADLPAPELRQLVVFKDNRDKQFKLASDGTPISESLFVEFHGRDVYAWSASSD